MTAPTSDKPAIDYTDKDYDALRQALLGLATYRLPEWTDRSAADLGMLLVDLFAYMGDIVSYYQDRIASESFLDTAVERRSIINLLRLIGYELAPPVASSAELTLVFNPPGPERGDDGRRPRRRRVRDHRRRDPGADRSSTWATIARSTSRGPRSLPARTASSRSRACPCGTADR